MARVFRPFPLKVGYTYQSLIMRATQEIISQRDTFIHESRRYSKVVFLMIIFSLTYKNPLYTNAFGTICIAFLQEFTKGIGIKIH